MAKKLIKWALLRISPNIGQIFNYRSYLMFMFISAMRIIWVIGKRWLARLQLGLDFGETT